LAKVLGRRSGNDADEPPALATILELNDAAGTGKQGIVLPTSDIGARPEASSSLPNQDGSTFDLLPSERLDPEPLGMAVPSVSGAALTFLVCHEVIPLPVLLSRLA
jgi:hypothetical protein